MANINDFLQAPVAFSPASPRPQTMGSPIMGSPHHGGGTPRSYARAGNKSALSRGAAQHHISHSHNTPSTLSSRHNAPRHNGLSVTQLHTPSTPQQPQTQSLRTNHEEKARGPPSASLQKQGPITPASSAHSMRSVNPGRDEGAAWVTVFGFPLEEKEKTLQEFKRLGAVLQDVYDGYNFMHIQYANAEVARRALDMNCRRHNGRDGRPYMIGVTECTENEVVLNQAMISRPNNSELSEAYIYNTNQRSQMDGFRNYKVQLNPDSQVAAQSESVLTKLGSYIFGA